MLDPDLKKLQESDILRAVCRNRQLFSVDRIKRYDVQCVHCAPALLEPHVLRSETASAIGMQISQPLNRS
jgi:hypothetical protein